MSRKISELIGKIDFSVSLLVSQFCMVRVLMIITKAIPVKLYFFLLKSPMMMVMVIKSFHFQEVEI